MSETGPVGARLRRGPLAPASLKEAVNARCGMAKFAGRPSDLVMSPELFEHDKPDKRTA